jgi:formate dehydrogenase beta subunit
MARELLPGRQAPECPRAIRVIRARQRFIPGPRSLHPPAVIRGPRAWRPASVKGESSVPAEPQESLPAPRVPPARTQRPLYVDRLPPCNHACPAGENVQAWLADAQAGRYRQAWETIVRDNPLPAVHGRVCYHPCEDSCNRKDVDEAVSIHAVERFLGDMALEQGWTITPDRPPTGRRVLVVGAGPSGLSIAWHLARLGHAVTIYEAGPMAGGMTHFGIPKYRLPREVLDAEIARIQAVGVEIVLNRKVVDVLADKQSGRFDAVFLAVGAHLSKRQDIPARDAGRIYDALAFLKDVEVGARPKLGRRVAIYGGGNTAMDAARTARRLGAEEALIIYRRTRAQMPAHDFEATEAIDEGIKIHWLRTIKQIDGSTFTVEVMKLDEKGFPQPTGEFETLEADSLILAVGQDTDTSFLQKVPGIEFQRDGTVVVGSDMQTGHAGIFAGGDMVPFDRTVTTAVGHGKKAARHVDAWLQGEILQPAAKHEIATSDMLHLWYHHEAKQRGQSVIDLERRRSTFEEVVKGLDAQSARYEAQRCLSCGNCFECDGCYSACPEKAVIKLGPGNRYVYDFDACTGCAICFEQCPCGAITMIPEPDGSVTVTAAV